MKKVLQRKFLWVMVWCLAFFFFLSYLVSVLGLSYYQPDHWQCLNLYVLQQNKEEPDVLFLGSSTMAMGIYPSIVEEEISRRTGHRISAFNGGQFGGNPAIDRAVLEDILGWRRKRPELIVLGADMQRYNTKGFSNELYYRYYADQFDILRSARALFDSDNTDAMIQGFLRGPSTLLWRAKDILFNESLSDVVAEEMKSGGSIVVKGNISERLGRTGRKELDRWNDMLEDYEISGEADQQLRDFIALCKARNIKLVVITIPLEGNFLQHFERQHKIFIEYIADVCRSQGIRFVDLQSEIRLSDHTCFANRAHLNEKGAKKVSAYVAKKIVLPELGLQERNPTQD